MLAEEREQPGDERGEVVELLVRVGARHGEVCVRERPEALEVLLVVEHLELLKDLFHHEMRDRVPSLIARCPLRCTPHGPGAGRTRRRAVPAPAPEASYPPPVGSPATMPARPPPPAGAPP